MDVLFVVSEATEKTAEQLDGLTVGGENDGAKGEGIISAILVVQRKLARLGYLLDKCFGLACGTVAVEVIHGQGPCSCQCP